MKKLIIILGLCFGGLINFIFFPIVAEAAVPSPSTLTEKQFDFAGFWEEQGYDISHCPYYLAFWSEHYQSYFVAFTTVKMDTFIDEASNGTECVHFDSSELFEWYSCYVYPDGSMKKDLVMIEKDKYPEGNGRVFFGKATDYTKSLVFVNSNYDIYNSYFGTLFFAKTPYHITSLVGGIRVAEIQETALAQVVGLVPLVVGLMILVITLSKGFLRLLTLLKRV